MPGVVINSCGDCPCIGRHPRGWSEGKCQHPDAPLGENNTKTLNNRPGWCPLLEGGDLVLSARPRLRGRTEHVAMLDAASTWTEAEMSRSPVAFDGALSWQEKYVVFDNGRRIRVMGATSWVDLADGRRVCVADLQVGDVVPRTDTIMDWTLTVVSVEVKEVYREDPEPEPPSRYDVLMDDDDAGP